MSAQDVLTIALDRAEPVVVLRVRGEVDAATVGELATSLDAAIREHDGRHLVLDGRDIGFIDSTGVTALVGAMRRLNRSRRRLGVACPPGSALARALRATGLEHSFDVHATVDAAVAELATAPLLGR